MKRVANIIIIIIKIIIIRQNAGEDVSHLTAKGH